MGIHDRQYYRDETAIRSGGLIRGHSAVAVLIAMNVGVFIMWLFAGPQSPFMDTHFTVSRPGILDQFLIHTLFLSEFSHNTPLHILFNMLFLYWFGRDLEAIYGSRDFFILYLFAALLSSIGHVLLVDHIPALGASGSVMAIVVCSACFYPDREVSILFGMLIPVKLKMKWLAIIFVGMDLAGVANPEGSGVAHGAHLGGALAGLLYYKFDLRLLPPGRPFLAGFFSAPANLLLFFFPNKDLGRLTWRARWRRLFHRRPSLRIVNPVQDSELFKPSVPEPVSVSAPSIDANTAKRVDDLLAKISLEGIGALTEEERDFLEHSSKKYKK